MRNQHLKVQKARPALKSQDQEIEVRAHYNEWISKDWRKKKIDTVRKKLLTRSLEEADMENLPLAKVNIIGILFTG
jgi:hypothetical protein